MVAVGFGLFAPVRKFLSRHQKLDSGATNSGSPALATRPSDPDLLSILGLRLPCCRCKPPAWVVPNGTEPATATYITVCPGAVQRVALRSRARTGLRLGFPPPNTHLLPPDASRRPAAPLTFVEKPFQVCEDAAEIWQTGHELLLV